MTQCRATKANGERCTLAANGPQGVCWAHDPANAAKRSRMASKAARSKPSGEIAGVKDRISVLADDVLSGEVDKGVAAVVSQVLNVYLRAVTVEIKVKEVGEFEERLAELERAAQNQSKGGRGTWHAPNNV